jgi:hypothetical protein
MITSSDSNSIFILPLKNNYLLLIFYVEYRPKQRSKHKYMMNDHPEKYNQTDHFIIEFNI